MPLGAQAQPAPTLALWAGSSLDGTRSGRPRTVRAPTAPRRRVHFASARPAGCSRKPVALRTCLLVRLGGCGLTTCAPAAGHHSPAHTALRSFGALTEGDARAEVRAPPACRLHARVRRHAAQKLVVSSSAIRKRGGPPLEMETAWATARFAGSVPAAAC